MYGAACFRPSFISSQLMFLGFSSEILPGSVGLDALQSRKERSATVWGLCGFLWKAKLKKAKGGAMLEPFPRS